MKLGNFDARSGTEIGTFPPPPAASEPSGAQE